MLKNSFCIPLNPPFLWYDQICYDSPYRSIQHCHPAWQLTVSVYGIFRFQYGKEIYEIQPGEWILFSPEQIHTAGSDSQESGAVQIFFHHFPGDFLPEFAEYFQLQRNVIFKGSTDRNALLQFVRSFSEIADGTADFILSRKRILPVHFLLEILRNFDFRKHRKSKITPAVLTVLEFMENHYQELLAVQDFADRVNLSPGRLNDCFRQATGISPMQYFNELRLGKAQQMLLSGKSVAETALLSGFSTPAYFCRKFKEYTGMTPGNFKKYQGLPENHP